MERTTEFSSVFDAVKERLFQTTGGGGSSTDVMPNGGASDTADTTATTTNAAAAVATATTIPSSSLEFRFKERVIHPDETLGDLDGFTAADHIEYIIY